MNPDRQQAINYLRAPDKGLWRWAENGAVLVWHDGGTIAFREEVVQILQWLAPNGLPSFGAIVFLLAACRGKVPTVSDVVTISTTTLPPAAGNDAALLVAARRQLKAQLEDALAQLKKVALLTSELNSRLTAKCVLTEAVFEPARAERHIEAQAVLSGLSGPINDTELIDPEKTDLSRSYIRQIHLVAEGLKRHTSESLALRLRTGLDALPQELDAKLPIAERARRLIEELSRNPEFGALARAARELMAAVRLPRRLGERDQLAIGGVADITNRGPLDRLLLSELAHDDLTLSVRVALNEALYLRREPPMREPPGTLALLMDCGIRLWGVPRVLATAVALALIARDKQHTQVLAWRAHGKQLQELDLLSRHGLIEHLGSLEPSAHAGDALPAFAQALAPAAQNQSVLITHRDALGDPEFRRALAATPDAPGFLAAVDREGHFELHTLPLAHRSPLCEADLDLTAVFDQPVAVSLIKPEADPDLPAIFGLSPFPFLLPLAGKVDCWIKAADGFTYAILNDRRLVQFRDRRSGGRVLASDLPGGKTIWMDCDGAEVHAVKTGSSQRPARLLSLSLPHGQLRVMDLASGPEVQAIHRYGEVLVTIRPQDVRACSLGDGRLLDQKPIPHSWLNGRFFRGTHHFYAAVWDGARVKFEPVTLPGTYLESSIATLFDRKGSAGPWMLCRSGQVVSTETGEVIKLPSLPNTKLDFSCVRVSGDGQHMWVPYAQNKPGDRPLGCLFGLEQGTILNPAPFANSVLETSPALPACNIYRIIESVAVCQDGLALRGRKNRWRELGLDGFGKLRITPNTSPTGLSREQSFTENPRKTSYGCTLQVARFPSGNRVFLDSRGLLHFKSPKPDLPEVSVVLAEGEAAGWTADGHVCGPEFFFDKPCTSEPRLVFERLKQFLTEL